MSDRLARTLSVEPGGDYFGYELNLAVNAQSGAEVWRDQKGKSGYAGGMLTTADNLVFYGSETGQFQAVNASTGEILYSFNLGGRPKSVPRVGRGRGGHPVLGEEAVAHLESAAFRVGQIGGWQAERVAVGAFHGCFAAQLGY